MLETLKKVDPRRLRFQEENSRNSQSALNSKDKSKASSASRIEHKALVHHSAAANAGSPDAAVAVQTIEEPPAQGSSPRWNGTRPSGGVSRGCRLKGRREYALARPRLLKKFGPTLVWVKFDRICWKRPGSRWPIRATSDRNGSIKSLYVIIRADGKFNCICFFLFPWPSKNILKLIAPLVYRFRYRYRRLAATAAVRVETNSFILVVAVLLQKFDRGKKKK